ncbi:MAG: hypothetical protein ACRCWR_06155 [Saezia sp.]
MDTGTGTGTDTGTTATDKAVGATDKELNFSNLRKTLTEKQGLLDAATKELEELRGKAEGPAWAKGVRERVKAAKPEVEDIDGLLAEAPDVLSDVFAGEAIKIAAANEQKALAHEARLREVDIRSSDLWQEAFTQPFTEAINTLSALIAPADMSEEELHTMQPEVEALFQGMAGKSQTESIRFLKLHNAARAAKGKPVLEGTYDDISRQIQIMKQANNNRDVLLSDFDSASKKRKDAEKMHQAQAMQQAMKETADNFKLASAVAEEEVFNLGLPGVTRDFLNERGRVDQAELLEIVGRRKEGSAVNSFKDRLLAASVPSLMNEIQRLRDDLAKASMGKIQATSPVPPVGTGSGSEYLVDAFFKR